MENFYATLILCFQVNRSGQFCGVAEMNGPVDFNKTMGFWQRDNWTGKVPLKWHIIKDVPNSQFRHIILENNDNKPVTNSRDKLLVIIKIWMAFLESSFNSNDMLVISLITKLKSQSLSHRRANYKMSHKVKERHRERQARYRLRESLCLCKM